MDETTSISRTATLAGFTAAVATTHGVHLRDLAPMTTLHVHTRNSLYRIIVSAGDAVLVEGGEFFPNLTPAHFSGASVGGSRSPSPSTVMLLERPGVRCGSSMRSTMPRISSAE